MTFSYTNCTTTTLNRHQITPLETSHEVSQTPSLAEKKIAKVHLPTVTPALNVSPAAFTLAKEKATPDAVFELLRKYGICTIKKLFDDSEIDSINEELDPLFELKKNDPRLFPKETIRITNTISKFPIVVNKSMSHPLNLAAAHKSLD